jgi:hypothetical protein
MRESGGEVETASWRGVEGWRRGKGEGGREKRRVSRREGKAGSRKMRKERKEGKGVDDGGFEPDPLIGNQMHCRPC